MWLNEQHAQGTENSEHCIGTLSIGTQSSYLAHFILCKQMQLPWQSGVMVTIEVSSYWLRAMWRWGGEGEERGDGVSDRNYGLISVSITRFLSHPQTRSLPHSPSPCSLLTYIYTRTKWLMFRFSPTPVITQCSVISSLFLNGPLNVLHVQSAV